MSKPKNLNLLTTSWDLWDFFVKEAGLDLQYYDTHIVEILCHHLGIPLPCSDLNSELKNRKISQETFLHAFLKVLQPYAQMLNDLCVFFWTYGVKKTNEGMRILFDFGKGPEDWEFDLTHFKEILQTYKTLIRSVIRYGWTPDNLWSLRSFFPTDDVDIEAQDAIIWLNRYYEQDEFSLPLPTRPLIGLNEIDPWIERVWQVWSTFVLECRRYSITRSKLHELGRAKRREKNDVQDLIDQPITIPQISQWDVDTLFRTDHDGWPASMLRALIGFLEHLIQLPEQDRRQEAIPVINEVQKLFASIPQTQEEIPVQIQNIIELLNLPFWKRRHELYQTWVLTQIVQAVSEYQPQIHHSNGTLLFKFSGTELGTFETTKGQIHIWSELRSPLDNPVGKGRKGNIQPDYSLTYEPITDISQTIIAIECKQYRRANSKNFADALIDYARGRPMATIFLVNYGRVPQNLLNRVSSHLRPRTRALGSFMPNDLQQLEQFQQMIREILPDPISKESMIKHLTHHSFSRIFIDVSGSMDDLLDDSSIQQTLKQFITHSPSAILLAIDTKIQKQWKNAEMGLQELLNMPRRLGTALSNVLATVDLTNTLVITDSSGWDQLKRLDPFPSLVIEIMEDMSLNFHQAPE